MTRSKRVKKRVRDEKPRRPATLSDEELESVAGGRITNIRAAPGAPSSSLIPQPVVER